MESRPNVLWILHCSCSDLNYKNAIPRLTNEELVFCLQKETRTSGLKMLRAEARRRKLETEEL